MRNAKRPSQILQVAFSPLLCYHPNIRCLHYKDMGNLSAANKLEFSRQHLQLFYTQDTSTEFFPFSRSNGFRNTQNIPQPIADITYLGEEKNEKNCTINKLKLVKKRVSDLNMYPYSCIGLLEVRINDKIVYGTGSLIGKNTIITAASNIYDKETSSQAKEIRFILNVKGQKGDIYLVHSSPHFHPKYIEEAQGSHRYNYAILQIKGKEQTAQIKEQQSHNLVKGVNNIDSNPGLLFGYLGFHTKFVGKEYIHIFGYSKEQMQNGAAEYAMRFEKTDKLLCKNSALGYTMQSVPSEAGSPILIRRNQYYQLVGIHISSRKQLSSGLQFDENIRVRMNSWISQLEGHINLAESALSEQAVQRIAMMEWHNMVIINLNKNSIKCMGLRRLTHRPWPMLRELYLSQNEISRLEFDPANIKNLQKLNLSKNSLRDVTMLSQLPFLRFLDVSYNKIESMDELLVLKYMQRLDLSYNRIRKISAQIQKLGEVRKLYFSKNQLSSLPAQLLKLKELIVLAIDKNKLKVSANDIIAKLQKRNVEVILQ